MFWSISILPSFLLQSEKCSGTLSTSGCRIPCLLIVRPEFVADLPKSFLLLESILFPSLTARLSIDFFSLLPSCSCNASIYISYLSCCCHQVPDKSQFRRKERFIPGYSLRVLSITVGKAWRQEREASGHIVSTVRKQRLMKGSTPLTFPVVFILLFQPMEWCLLYLVWIVSLQ